MKKSKILVLASALLFTGCSSVVNQTPATPTTGDLTEGKINEENKIEVKKLYETSLDTAEELDSFDVDSSEENNPSEETPSNEENQSSSADTITSEETSETPEEETTNEEITSYHVDYVVDYSLSVTLGDAPFYSISEKQLYSLTYIELDEENIYLDLTTKYTYQETYSFMGSDFSETYSHEISLKYQDNYLFVTQKIGDRDAKKTKHDIDISKLRDEYGDYLIYTSVNAMFDPSSRENNRALVEELLTNDTVKIVSVDDNTVTIEFDYEDGIATMVFDTTLNAFTSVTFDKSKEKDDVVISDTSYTTDEVESTETESTEEITESSDEATKPSEDQYSEIDRGFGVEHEDDEEQWHHDKEEDHKDDHKHENNPFIEDYTYIVNMNFSYNNQEADLLTDEEKAEFKDYSKDYRHENGYHGEGNHGYHGGRDEHHKDDYYEPEYDFDYDFDDSDYEYDDFEFEENEHREENGSEHHQNYHEF